MSEFPYGKFGMFIAPDGRRYRLTAIAGLINEIMVLEMFEIEKTEQGWLEFHYTRGKGGLRKVTGNKKHHMDMKKEGGRALG
jgi:hypothetical protein